MISNEKRTKSCKPFPNNLKPMHDYDWKKTNLKFLLQRVIALRINIFSQFYFLELDKNVCCIECNYYLKNLPYSPALDQYPVGGSQYKIFSQIFI
jgi:hypothetical protein